MAIGSARQCDVVITSIERWRGQEQNSGLVAQRPAEGLGTGARLPRRLSRNRCSAARAVATFADDARDAAELRWTPGGGSTDTLPGQHCNLLATQLGNAEPCPLLRRSIIAPRAFDPEKTLGGVGAVSSWDWLTRRDRMRPASDSSDVRLAADVAELHRDRLGRGR